MTDIDGHRNDLFHVIEGGEVKHRHRYEAGDPTLGLDPGEAFDLFTQHIAAHKQGPGMLPSDVPLIPCINEKEFTSAMDNDITPDPTRFSWHVGGVLDSGSLYDYARQWKDRYYSGDLDGLGDVVVYWPSPDAEPVKLPVSVTRLDIDENDYIHCRLSVPGGRNMIGGQVRFTIDGRA